MGDQTQTMFGHYMILLAYCCTMTLLSKWRTSESEDVSNVQRNGAKAVELVNKHKVRKLYWRLYWRFNAIS